MLVTDSIDEIRSAVKLWKREKLSVALVPTMGALHEGHLALIRQARQEADRVVVSIFVNPEQFGPDEDYDRYPRRPDDDLKFCQKSRVSAVFMPETSTIYPEEPRSEEHTSELQSRGHLVCRLLLEKKKGEPRSNGRSKDES